MPGKLLAKLLEKGLLKQSSIVFIASLAGSLALFASSIVLARVFGPVDFANFKIATNLFIFLPSLIEFGIGITLVKYIAEYNVSQKEKIPSLVTFFIKIRTVSFAVLICLLFLFRKEIASLFFQSPNEYFLVIGGIWISGFMFFEIFKQIALGFQEFRQYAISQFLVFFLSGVLSLVFGYYFGVFYALLGWGLAYFVGNLPVFFFAFRKIGPIPPKPFEMKKIFFSFSLPMYSLIIPNLLGTALVPLVSLFFEKEPVGIFAFGMIFFNGVSLIPNAFNSILFPSLSESIGKKENTRAILKRIAIQYTIVMVPLVAIAAFAVGPLLSIIAPAYLKGLSMLIALIFSSYLFGYFTFAGSYCMATEKVKESWVVTVAKNILLLVMAFLAMLLL